MPRKATPASVKEQVTAHIEALRREQQLDTQGEALASVALKLAGLLDGGDPVLMTGTWARELRSTLLALAPKGGSGDGDDDSWLAELSAPLRDTSE